MNPRILPKEHCQRLQALQRKVREHDLDAFIVSSFESIFYLTGAGFEPLERPFFLVVKPEGEPVLLVPKLDQEHMTKAAGIERRNITTYREYPAPVMSGWPSRLKEILPPQGPIGVEPSVRREITDQLPDSSLRTEPLVEQLRLLKSPAEVEMIRRASHYADFGVKRLLSASYFGSMVAEGFAETRTVSAQIIREVENWDPLTTNVLMASWAAPHSAMPHSVPSLEHRLETGSHVALVLTRVNGYAAESERTYFTAPPSKDARVAFDAMTKAREIAFEMLKPGLPCGEVDAVVNDFLGREGFLDDDQRLHRTGHGIGLGTHEAPWLAEGSVDRLAENMVISVEPGIYLPGVGGIRHSDTVLVTNDGHERLTHFPTGLDSLVIRNWKPRARLTGQLLRRKLRLTGRGEASHASPDSRFARLIGQ
jgi:Xaa-Pro dipeptidase